MLHRLHILEQNTIILCKLFVKSRVILLYVVLYQVRHIMPKDLSVILSILFSVTLKIIALCRKFHENSVLVSQHYAHHAGEILAIFLPPPKKYLHRNTSKNVSSTIKAPRKVSGLLDLPRLSWLSGTNETYSNSVFIYLL